MSIAEPAGHSGEMARLIHERDWATTPLGSADSWSSSLKLALAMILASGFPMAIRWGPELILLYNDAYRPILGGKHPAALGRPLREVWSEIYSELGPLNEAIMRGERPAFFAEDHPWTVRRRNDMPEDARFTISYSPIPDAAAANGVGGILTTCIETTERVRNEATLRRLNDSLETEVAQRTLERDRIWQVSEDLLGVSNFDGYFTSVNPAWTTLLGWREDEIKKMHVSQLRHPEDAVAAMAGRARLAAGTPTVRMENRFRHRDGSWRWVAWTMTAEAGLIYVIGRHVTGEKAAAEALRESDRQFRMFVDAVTDYALIRLDARGVVSSWNAGAERINGYSQREIVGRHFSTFYTEADRAAGIPDMALAEAAKSGTFEIEGWRVRKDGSLFFADVIIDAIRDQRGELVGFAKITRDVTERRDAQDRLRRAQQHLAQSQKMEALGQLTGGVAHDFNNVLMVVSGNAETLRRRLSHAGDLRAVEAIEMAAARGESLTRQLLAFSRRQTLNPTVVDLGRRLTSFRDVLASSARGAVKLTIDIPGSVWPVAVDVPELELALVNLVVNARDAMPEGGTITISAANVRLEADDTPEGVHGDFVALRVADTGCGIAPELLSKVFEPFFTTKQREQGTGLGLAQVYGFARQSGGTAAISSTPGEGTLLTIYLPRSRRAPAREADPDGLAESDAPPTGSETILLVEDNPEVDEVAGMLLEELGYRVLHADSAAAALARLAAGEDVDLVFTDVVMPGELDGVGLATRIRQEFPRLAVLLTSGYVKAANAAAGFPILRKPYRLEALGRAVRQALDTRTLVRN
ncbi:MAG TPA: PAS domain S-box protein [Stellaceae bacterium]